MKIIKESIYFQMKLPLGFVQMKKNIDRIWISYVPGNRTQHEKS
jgi:hypothetical protein